MPRTTFYRRIPMPVTIHPNIGLDAGVRQSVIKMLNLILADEAVLALKTSQADGHAMGLEVHELQTLYDAQYQQISAISTEIVERIQILGGSRVSSEKDLMDLARLDGERNAVPGIVDLLADHEALTRFLREDAQKCAEIYDDQGTFALLVSVIRIHEKMDWMLRSNIAAEKFQDEK